MAFGLLTLGWRWAYTFHIFCVDFICVWWSTQSQYPTEYGLKTYSYLVPLITLKHVPTWRFLFACYYPRTCSYLAFSALARFSLMCWSICLALTMTLTLLTLLTLSTPYYNKTYSYLVFSCAPYYTETCFYLAFSCTPYYTKTCSHLAFFVCLLLH